MVKQVVESQLSTVITAISNFINHILVKEGDYLDSPYVLLSGVTQSAESTINGQTLHTLFRLTLVQNINY